MNRYALALILITTGLAPLAAAFDQSYYEKQTKAQVYKGKNGDELPYRLFIPKGYDPQQKYPLLLALHGAGGRGNDNKKHLADYLAGWTAEEIQEKHPCFILMPQCPSEQQWVNTPWANGSYASANLPISKTLLAAKELLDKVRGEYAIDPSRVYVMGASMGGYGTWDMIARYPDAFAAAIPICGAGDPQTAAKLAALPIWAFHGDKDETVPFSGSKEMVDAIEKAGGKKIKFTVYKGVAHEACDLAWKEKELVEWLFSQRRPGTKAARAAEDKVEPAAPASAGDRVILNRDTYFRVHTEFGLLKLNGDILKSDGEKLFGKSLPRAEQYIKRLLASRNYDWAKTDWRDVACYHWIMGQAGDDLDVVGLIRGVPPPADWMMPDFDDSAFDRQRMGTLNYLGDANICVQEVYGLHRRALYERTYFEVPDPAAGDLSVSLTYLGGARVFVNGVEIGRGHLPAGALNSESFGADYPLEAYLAEAGEVGDKRTDFGGDLRCSFDVAAALQRKKPTDFCQTYGLTLLNRAGWDRLLKLRNRQLGPIAIPRNLLRKGANVLAIELRSSRYHPVVVAGARGNETAWRGSYGWHPKWEHLRLVDVTLRGAGKSVPAGSTRPAGLRVWVDDMHTRLYDRDTNPPGWPVGVARLVGARNGTYAAQLGAVADKELTGLAVVCGDLAGENGAKIPAAAFQVQYLVGHPVVEMSLLGRMRSLPSDLHGMCQNALDAQYRYSEGIDSFADASKNPEAVAAVKSKLVQDLKFFDELNPLPPPAVPANTCQPVWLSLKIPENAPAGKYKGSVTVQAAGQTPVTVPVEAEVIGWRVPSPLEFRMFVQAEQSPYGIANHYKLPLWSEKHWSLIESSFRQLAHIGNRWVFVPVLLNSELGNRDDTMVRWIRKKDGTLAFDFSLMDKYLALAERIQGRPRAVCLLVMHGATCTSNAVKIEDEATGKTEVVEVGPGQDATRRPLWSAFGAAAHAHMKSLGLADVMYWGHAFDDVPDKEIIPIMAEAAPGVYWALASHGRGPDETFRIGARAYCVDVRPVSCQGWKHPFVHLLMPRIGGSIMAVEGASTPFTWRMMCDRALHSGFNGLARLGADYFDRTFMDGFKSTMWNMAGRPAVQTLWPGADRINGGQRNEALLEGLQEAEVRIFLEQALDRKVLPPDLAAEVDSTLADHFRGTLHIATGAEDHQTMDLTNHWQTRSRRLYRAAAKVAEKIGIDVDQTAFGETRVNYFSIGEKQSFSGGKLTVPAWGRTRVTVKLRNWSDTPRAWKAASSDAWIAPEKSEGVVSGQQELRIVLDGKTLKADSDVAGTLSITDVAAGTVYPITISASVGKAMEFQLRQNFQYWAGGGSAGEGMKLIRVVREPVFNVPAGGSDTRSFPLVSHAAEKQSWKIESDCDWLTAEPGAGEIAPDATTPVRLVARPKDKGNAVYEPTLTLTAAGGAIRETYKLKVNVIPPYQAPVVPAGDFVYLNALDQSKFMKGHMDAGFTKDNGGRSRTRPGTIGDVPLPYYNRFNRVEARPENVKLDDANSMPYTLGGKTYTHGLWVWPTHETLYAIENAGFKAFAAEVGYCYDKLAKKDFANLSAVVNFEVYVDGKLRAQSGLMKYGDAPRLLVADNLEGAKEVKLVTRRDDMIDDFYTVATWADPRFIKK